MRKGAFADNEEGGFRCAGDPSLREEERFGRDDADRVCALAFIDLARGFTRKGTIADKAEGEFRCAGDPSLREEERCGRDDADRVGTLALIDADRVCALGLIDLARGFTY